MLKRKDYPKTFRIGTEDYRIKFVRKFDKGEEDHLADCDPVKHLIRIRVGQTDEMNFRCLIHELLHAIGEFEHDTKIPHKLIHALETPFYQFIRENFFK